MGVLLGAALVGAGVTLIVAVTRHPPVAMSASGPSPGNPPETPPEDPGEWGDTLVTPQDLVTTYNYLADNLPPPAHDLLYNALYHASRTAADGTDQYFGIPDGLPGTTWAIKQGWGSSGTKAELNTTGLVGADARYVVIVLASAPLSAYRQLPVALTNGTAQLAGLVSGP
ncbi:hypothetical protein Atai01_64420 [Amycolatopsis taiwanensis]|uniref:Uncharacterized protein n=1 Tax=Amycolatopsis taiwanensis TaxID=342230 RepID=A0A9W6R6V1_9PSEU|nr:hypothetical protein Atai01_64420 [Amycolatopsis taiwanensis]